jgi:type VI secretion system protein ImpG
MDSRLLEFYNRELQFVREMGSEFAREFPKIAGRLGLDEFECADPYVERLLEGFAFLAGRVQLKLDAEYPRISEHLLEIVYPHYLAPTPSMAVVQLQPGQDIVSLTDGFLVPRDSVLRSHVSRGEQTRCEFRTCHEVKLWPLEIAEAEYMTNLERVAGALSSSTKPARAGIRLRLKTKGALPIRKLSLDTLGVFLPGRDQTAFRIYEQVHANGLGVVARAVQSSAAEVLVTERAQIRTLGFSDREALLPTTTPSFSGYRLLQEYFAFPQRFMFFELCGLREIFGRCEGSEIDLVVLLDTVSKSLENALNASDFALFCAPAINLFPKKADRIHVSARQDEYHLVPDRSRPLDFEVFQVRDVVGYDAGSEQKLEFLPFYALRGNPSAKLRHGYYTIHREPRNLSAREKLRGTRSSYAGGEIYLSLVDASEAPFPASVKQLSVSTLCTNRDVPLTMPIGAGASDFDLESGAPVQAIRCLAGPTEPKPSITRLSGELTWRLVNHLSLNYLSLLTADEKQGAGGLRDLLRLYGEAKNPAIGKQIEGIRSIQATRVTRRLPLPGPAAFGRGIEVSMTCEDQAFQGSGVFLFGAVLNEFISKYVSINSFTELVLKTTERGEIMRWSANPGRRTVV